MAFYLSPVSGNVSLNKLETFAITRLKFLLQVQKIGSDRVRMHDLVHGLDTVANSDCLIEGTQKDNISHFICRLLLPDCQETTEFIVRTEVRLFRFRFTCLSEEEIYRLLKSTEKKLNVTKWPKPSTYDHMNIQHVLAALLMIKHSSRSWKNVAYLYMHENTNECFQVPYQSVLPLVAKRIVSLNCGWASVSYRHLETVLTTLFEDALRLSLKLKMETRQTALEDVRMKRLAKLLKSIYRAEIPPTVEWSDLPFLSSDEVDQSQLLFPACMSHLHTLLRRMHHLKHNDRIQYSLFLKEAGMSVHQAVMFWQQEYSQPPTRPPLGTCHRSWHTDAHRYMYNIRHMYGLEGSRTNYRGHCCASLQRRQLGSLEQGGCPFVHFGDEELIDLLKADNIDEPDQQAIIDMRTTFPIRACEIHLKFKIRCLTLGCSPRQELNLRDKKDKKKTTCRDNEKNGRDGITHLCTRSLPIRTRNGTDSSDSDDDVIIVEKKRTAATKRRSLSSNMSKSGVKKRVIWSFEKPNADSNDHHRTQSIDYSPMINGHETVPIHDENNLSEGKQVNHSTQTTSQTKGSNSAIHCHSENDNSGFGPTSVGGLDETLKRVSCFEHTVCLSQVESDKSLLIQLSQTRENLGQFDQITIHKPIDYYRTFKQLLQGLKNNTP